MQLPRPCGFNSLRTEIEADYCLQLAPRLAPTPSGPRAPRVPGFPREPRTGAGRPRPFVAYHLQSPYRAARKPAKGRQI